MNNSLRAQLEVHAVAYGASHVLEDLHSELLRVAETPPGPKRVLAQG